MAIKNYTSVFSTLVLFFLLFSGSSPALANTGEKALPNQLCDRIERIQQQKKLEIHGEKIAALQLIPQFYARRDFTLAWHSDRNIEELLTAIDASADEGLIPGDYHQDALHAMFELYRTGEMPTCERADFDILLTDALIRLGYHYSYGKVDPKRLDSHWNLKRELPGDDPVQLLQESIDADSLSVSLRQLAPNSPFYDEMKAALSHYQALQAKGGWPSIPEGPSIKPGMKDARLESMRQRLTITGDLQNPVSDDPAYYDDGLQAAVIRFQERHSLDSDGIIGRSTLAAMNLPISDRINQIRVNLERARWVYRNLPSEFLVTDIAGFRASLIRNGQVVWESVVQVGKPYRATPVFQDSMQYLEFNPTWTVPPTILQKDILPKLREDPGYLQEKEMEVIDSTGAAIDASSIDWSTVTSKNFRYMLRQKPGPKNALGRVKFMFPNKYAVYLHDTPYKSGFKRAERAFSSGCIRVQKSFELAEILLNDPQNWSREKIEQTIEAGQTKSVPLKTKLPVFLLYWTVGAKDGRFYFKPDVYSRDAAVLAALDGEFRLDLPDNMPDWYEK
jgi:murein L,D-transpeptidase YcbB/YkuD